MEERRELGDSSLPGDTGAGTPSGEDGVMPAVRPRQSTVPIPGVLTATSYIPPEVLPYERWISIGETFQQMDQQMERSIEFWLGDWWNYGELKYGKLKYGDYAAAAQELWDPVEQATGRTMQTIDECGWVCRVVAPSLREEKLTFAHHRSVAKLAAEHPDRAAALLRQAAEAPQNWSAAELKREAEMVRRELATEPAPSTKTVPARLEVADATRMLLEGGSVDLIVTSPPYGLDKRYRDLEDPSEGWPRFMRDWLGEGFRVAREHGRLALNVPLDTTRGGFRPTYAQAVAAAIEAGWTYRTTIVGHEDNISRSTGPGSVASPAAPHVIARVEMIALFSKGTWTRDPQGRTWDLTDTEWLSWTNGYWRFVSEAPFWEEDPAASPEEVPWRLIRLLSYHGDVVLDPFCGSGTVPLVAQQLGRQAIGFDIDEAYVESARRRLAAALEGWGACPCGDARTHGHAPQPPRGA